MYDRQGNGDLKRIKMGGKDEKIYKSEISTCSFFKRDFIYLFLERGEGGRKTEMYGCLLPGLQPRNVP